VVASMELPKTFVHAIHLHMERTIPALVVSNDGFESDQRTPGVEALAEVCLLADVIRQFFSKEPGGRDDFGGSAKSIEEQIAKACSHGIPDEQSAREHRDSSTDAEHDSQISAPVVREIT